MDRCKEWELDYNPIFVLPRIGRQTLSQTDFLAGDSVWFDDSVGAGSTAVEILDANVNPAYVKFNNNTKNYTVSSAGGYGIASGIVTKSGTGAVTLNTA